MMSNDVPGAITDSVQGIVDKDVVIQTYLYSLKTEQNQEFTEKLSGIFKQMSETKDVNEFTRLSEEAYDYYNDVKGELD